MSRASDPGSAPAASPVPSRRMEDPRGTGGRLSLPPGDMIESLPFPVRVLDLDFRYVFANAAHRRLARREDLIGRHVEEVLGPEVMSLARPYIVRACEGESCEGEIFYGSHPAGPLWAHSHFSPLRDPAGNVCGVVVASQITGERHRAERQAQGAELRYRRLFDSAADGILLVQMGRVVEANPRAEDILGRAPGGLVGLALTELSVPTQPDGRVSREVIGRVLERAYRGKSAVREWVAVAGDGSPVDVEVALTGWTAEGVSMALCHIRDIGARKRAEARANEANAGMKASFEASLDGIVILDDHGVVVSINQAALGIFGYEIGEVLGRELADLVMTADDAARHRVGLGRPTRAGGGLAQGFRKEVHGQRKDGSQVPLLISVRQVAVGGSTHFVGYLHDLTGRQALESQFRTAQRTEIIARLSAGVAHDFNNLLTPILGLVDLHSDGIEDPDLREDLLEIGGAARRGAALTRRLLEFSRPLDEEPGLCDVAETISQAELLIERLVGPAIDVRVCVEGDCAVLGSPVQIEQVLLNLVVNARDAMPGGGVLEIDVGRTEDRPGPQASEGGGDWVQIRVRDTGYGMDEETVQRIFDPYFSSKGERGTGLGLFTVMGIIEAHGGSIQVESAVGYGTTFVVLLPHTDLDRAGVEAPVPDRICVAPDACALVVDDETQVRAVVSRILERRGFRVVEASDGEEAVELLEEMPPPALIISDQWMPGMPGTAVLRFAAGRYPHAALILASGYVDSLNLAEMPEKAVYLAKPFMTAQLTAAIGEALSGNAGHVGVT